MGIGEALMQGCSDACITKEFASFSMFDIGVWGTLRDSKRSLYKRFEGGGTLLCQWLVLVLQRGGLVMRFQSQMFAAWTRQMKRVNHGGEAWNRPKCVMSA